jgi:hypothetical protein
LPHYGTTLPLTRAITCHCQAQNDTSGAGKNSHSLFYSSPFTKSAETPINTGVARGEKLRTTLHHPSPSDYAPKLNEKLDLFGLLKKVTQISQMTQIFRVKGG